MKNLNKKARIAIAIADVFSYVVFALGIVILICLFSLRSCVTESMSSEVVESTFINHDKYYTLSNMLKTPVQIEVPSAAPEIKAKHYETTVADMIAIYKQDKSTEEALQKQLASVIEKRYQYCVVLCIDDKKMNFNDCTLYNTYCQEEPDLLIPDYSGKPVSISLNTNPEHIAKTAVKYSSPLMYLAIEELK